VRDEAQTRQGAILDAYLFLACQQPAALKSRIERLNWRQKIESCDCATPVTSDRERGASQGHEDSNESRAYPESFLLETHESSSVLGVRGECS
jgi:hypothetical protein